MQRTFFSDTIRFSSVCLIHTKLIVLVNTSNHAANVLLECRGKALEYVSLKGNKPIISHNNNVYWSVVASLIVFHQLPLFYHAEYFFLVSVIVVCRISFCFEQVYSMQSSLLGAISKHAHTHSSTHARTHAHTRTHTHTRTRTHTHTPVSYTHLTLPTSLRV